MSSRSPYERIRDANLARGACAVSGGLAATACIVSERPLPEAARAALLASLKARGHDERQIAFAVRPDDAADAERWVMHAVEALDPLCVVIADRASAQEASRDYNTPLALEADALLLGRPCRCFEDFAALLDDEAGKQRAWAALKSLPALRRS